MSQMQPFPYHLVPHVHLNDHLRLPRRFPHPGEPDTAYSLSTFPESAPGAGGPTPAPEVSEHEPVIHR
jgi:hypothetical protein